MKNKRLHFRLENPCEANRDNLLPEEKGFFCLLCQKKVIDFANMTDDAIFDFFQDKNNLLFGCGQYTERQLSEGIMAKQQALHHIPTFRKIAVITILGLSMTGLPLKLQAQSVIEEVIPAEYQEVTKKYLLPERYEEIEVPAEYTTVQKTVLIKKGGGYVEWRESCGAKMENHISVAISAIQQALTEKYFYKGDIDNIWGEATRQALMEFKQKNGLAISTDFDEETLTALGVLK